MADLDSLGNYPTTPSFQAVGFKSTTPTIITETNSGKIRRYGYGVSYYTWTAKYGPQPSRDLGPVLGYIGAAYGPQLSFQIVLPEISYSKSDNPPSTTPQTSATVAKGVNTVTLSNCGANKEVLRGGDFFKFNNHSKVYQCSVTCNSNGSGAATLYFTGSLVSGVPSSTALTITAVPFTAIFASEEQSWDVGVGGLTSMTVEMREVW
jgi:hypothetical protein